MRENYGFEKVDMHEIPGVIRCFVNPDLQMVIAEADELISRRCSNSIPDNMQEQMHIFTTFQNKIACHFLLPSKILLPSSCTAKISTSEYISR